MPDSPDPKVIAQSLMPKWQFDFAPALSAVHAQMFDQMLTLGLTVQARLTIPASEQPRAAGRSIDAPDYAACALVRAIRDLALSSDRIINQAKAASMWQTTNHYEVGDTNRIEELAEAVARRAIEPLPKILAPTAEAPRVKTDKRIRPASPLITLSIALAMGRAGLRSKPGGATRWRITVHRPRPHLSRHVAARHPLPPMGGEGIWSDNAA